MNPEETKSFIKRFLQEESKETLNEFKRNEAGEKIEFDDFHDAVEKLYAKYTNGEISAYCDNVLQKTKPLKYKGQEIELCLVISGEIVETNGSFEIVYNSGLGHSMQKHTEKVVDGKVVTEKELKNALKELPVALKRGDRYDENVVIKDSNGQERVVTRLLIDYNEFVYIIAFAEDESEINYLMNTFKPDKGYIQRKMEDDEITPIQKG